MFVTETKTVFIFVPVVSFDESLRSFPFYLFNFSQFTSVI